MAYKVILDDRITEYGVVAHIPIDEMFRVIQLGPNGEIPELLCPHCNKEHLTPGRLEKGFTKDDGFFVMFLNVFCPKDGTHFDVRDEDIYMNKSDAIKYDGYWTE